MEKPRRAPQPTKATQLLLSAREHLGIAESGRLSPAEAERHRIEASKLVGGVIIITAPLVARWAWRYARSHHEHDDIIQDIRSKLWRSAAGFKGGSQAESWLYHITRSVALDRQEKEKKYLLQDQRVIEEDIFETQPDEGLDSNPEMSVLNDEATAQILADMEVLNPAERMFMWAHYVQGVSIEELSSRTGVKENTIKSHLLRGRAKLKKIIEERGKA